MLKASLSFVRRRVDRDGLQIQVRPTCPACVTTVRSACASCRVLPHAALADFRQLVHTPWTAVIHDASLIALHEVVCSELMLAPTVGGPTKETAVTPYPGSLDTRLLGYCGSWLLRYSTYAGTT